MDEAKNELQQHVHSFNPDSVCITTTLTNLISFVNNDQQVCKVEVFTFVQLMDTLDNLLRNFALWHLQL